jgi:hypothetical protein
VAAHTMLSEHANDDRALDLRNPEKMVSAKLVLVRKQVLFPERL